MVAHKIETLYTSWAAAINSKSPQQIDVSNLFELAYQIYLAQQQDDPQWQNVSGGKWLADRLTKDGRFSNHQINRLSYLIEDIINYNHWLFNRNNEQ